MNYSFKCPACEHTITVEAENDDEAVQKINTEGVVHAQQVHPEMPPMSEEQMTQMVRENMTREEV